MNRAIRTLILAAGCVLLAGCATQPAPQAAAPAPDPKILRVGVTPNAPPLIFKEGGLVGAEADLAQALGRDLGRKVVFVEEKWENLIDSLCDNRIDIIMSPMTITLARSYRIAFSDPYLNVGQMALARSGDTYNYVLNLASQAKRGIGVKPGTTADLLVRQEMPGVTRKYFPDGEAAAEALLKQKVDLFISDSPMIWYLAGHYETKGLSVIPIMLSQEQLGWGVRRSDTELLKQVNAFLAKAQTSGELSRILGRWMPGLR
jgi:polar amino acid transport system substrate-binding protein